ncbi:ammonium transporter Amt3 [Balamuthia mandrillaris]
MSTFVYPVAAHWIWSEQGWLSASGDGVWSVGTIDFAGSTVVHCVGGFSALVGAKAVGFRGQYPPLDENEEHVARFEKVKGKRLWRVNPMPANDESLATLGVLLLWFGWYGFNCGSILEIVGNEKIAGRVAINSTLSPSVASLSCILLGRIVSQFKDEPEERQFYLSDALNGILAGLVSITAGCAVVEPWAAIIIGGLSCIVYKTASELLLLFRIDDPVDAAAVHAFCGVWGTIAVGLFASSDHVKEVYGDGAHYGLFMGGGGRRLLMQIVGCSTVILWSLFWSTLMFTFILFANRMTEVFFRTSFFIQKGGQTERLGFGVSKTPTIRIASTFIIPSASLHHGELSRNESTNSVAQEMHSLKSFEQPIDKEGKEDDEDSSDDDGDGRDEKQKGSQNKKTGSQRRLSHLGSSFSSFGSLKGKKEEQSNKIGVQDGGDTPKGPLSKEGSIRLGKKESSPSMASSPKEPKNMESNDSDSTTEESDYY